MTGMTKRPKDARISDSASGGKGESMASETRETVCGCYCHKGGGLKPCFYCANAHNFYGAVAPGRPSDDPAQGSEARPGVGTAVESDTADEKGLASRVEELENLIAKHSGSLNSADSASNTESSSTAKETRNAALRDRVCEGCVSDDMEPHDQSICDKVSQTGKNGVNENFPE